MPSYETLAYEEDAGAAIVRFDRPEVMNAMSPELIEELEAALDHAERAEGVRAVVLTGNGRAFSSGYDVGSLAETLDERETAEGFDLDAEVADVTRSKHRHIWAVYDCHLPVIAAVNGYCLAGASDLLSVCDIAIASEAADFGYPPVRRGGPPVPLTYPWAMSSMRYVKELLLTGKRVDAATAERFGWVNRTVPHDDLLAEAMAEVAAIRKVPSSVVRLMKRELNAVMETQGFLPHARQMPNAAALMHQIPEADEYRRILAEEGMQAAIDYMEEADKA